MGDITEHFSLHEFSDSQKANELGIDNTMPPEVIGHIITLTKRVLEPIRCFLDDVVHVSSGYRCPLLNSAVRGVENSSHMYGYAADIVCVDLEVVFEWAKVHLSYDKIILEYHNGKAWIHVSYKNASLNRNKAYIYKNGVYNEV